MRTTPAVGGMLLALAIGISGGLLANAIGLPLPWMLGPMMANVVAALLRAPVVGPVKVRPYVIPILGVLLGSGVTPEVLGLLRNWAFTLALLPVFLAFASAISYAVYRRIGGYDPTTAFYSAMPGGLNEMLILGAAAGGDERRIAMAHAARVMMVIVFVALFFGLFLGVTSNGQSASWIALNEITLRDYVILGLCAVLGSILGKRLGLPAAAIFGPLILSALTHATGWVTAAPPTIFVIAAQITIGTVIGTRFVGATLRDLRGDLGLAIIATFLMLVAAVIFAELIFLLSGVPLTQGFLAFSPGGLAEMSLLALAMDQNATYVSIMHIIRITMVIAVAPYLFRWTR